MGRSAYTVALRDGVIRRGAGQTQGDSPGLSELSGLVSGLSRAGRARAAPLG